ncbi:MAG: Cell division protein FtsH (EC [uncultured Sulfurovum sp.]|uniref:Cell division protein FtsH (EC) n=1 Tax=uncultured Sulfurovum sp. TaxID=269237 RepID=A0A6S6SF07_9BACT|nr:MAG: Cell division protein FtsH (EC [uncultured Sulfurovum sp.]
MNEGLHFIKDANNMKDALKKELFGQDRAIEVIANSIQSNIVIDRNTPKATYLFLGPPATGKTYLSELMTAEMSEYKIRKFDMTQYHEQNGGELYGYPKGWSGYGVGQLTGFVFDNPKSIIVLDAFEKADNVIQNNLLSIFEGGEMRDACGWDKMTDQPCSDDDAKIYNEGNANFIVDFRKTIFIITSSLGKELYSDTKFINLVDDDYIQAETMILDALKREEKRNIKSGGSEKAIIPELISRFSQATIVLFNKLNYVAYEAIGKKAFLEYKDVFEETMELDLKIDRHFENFLKTQILVFAPEFDARRIKNKVGELFFSKVTDYISSIGKDITQFSDIKISIAKKAVDFLNENIHTLIEEDKLVKELFRKNIKLEVEDAFTVKDETITYKIKNCSFKQVKRIRDFSEDGLVFDIPNVSFNDIAGHHKAKSRLSEVIKFLKEPKLLQDFNVQPPKGMLLYGPPGTGKTLLAKAFSAEAELPFISITGVELLQLDKIKKVFEKAKDYAPAIIFIDEIDTIGKREKANNREVQINKFLAEMDGFGNKEDEHVFIIAATNYKENIDPAIIRPGRIEIHIPIDDLDKDARKYFIDKIIKEKPTSGKFDMNKLLISTAGLTGAQLELISKEASFYCIRHDIPAITQEVLIEQINFVKYGEGHATILDEKSYEKTAIREAAHVVLSKTLMPNVPLKQVSVIPKNHSNGFIDTNYDKLQKNITIEGMKSRICISLSGRIAQMKKYGAIDGLDMEASSDLKHAINDAFIAVAHYGMDEEVRYINVKDVKKDDSQSTDTSNNHTNDNKVNDAIERWMRECEELTSQLVNENWERIEKLSIMLLEKEIMYEEDLEGF